VHRHKRGSILLFEIAQHNFKKKTHTLTPALISMATKDGPDGGATGSGLVLRAENALSGATILPEVQIRRKETVGQLCARLSADVAYRVVSEDGGFVNNRRGAFKTLKDAECIRLVVSKNHASFKCYVCKQSFSGTVYRSKLSEKIVCPHHHQQLRAGFKTFFQELNGLPNIKSSKNCEVCRSKVRGDCYYVTPTGGVFCEQHVQQFGPKGVEMCRAVTGGDLRAWRAATRGMIRMYSRASRYDGL
jgi:hypothetical protein